MKEIGDKMTQWELLTSEEFENLALAYAQFQYNMNLAAQH